MVPDTGKKWIIAAVTHLLFDDCLLLDETDGSIRESGRGEGWQGVAFAVGVFSIRLMIVDHQFCMAAHSAEKDLCTATKGALVRSLSVVPLAGEEGVPSRFSEPLGKGHLRLGNIEDIARQPMQRTTGHHHVSTGRTYSSTGRPHAIGVGKASSHPDQSVQCRGLNRFIP